MLLKGKKIITYLLYLGEKINKKKTKNVHIKFEGIKIF